jgi:ribosomal protein S18 acetylase RimI-like enzyme
VTGAPAVVRPATPADRAALGRLGALLVTAHYEMDPQRFIAPGAGTEAGYGGWLVSQLKQRDAVVLVAERAGQVLGYAYGGLEGNDWLALRGPAGVVHDLLVDPAHRGEGLGRQLLEALVEALIARGAPRIVLLTAERNQAAQRLFASAAFRRTMIEMTREAESGS